MFTKINFAVGTAALTINSWLPTLDTVSTWFALWVPILGGCLLVLQITKLLHDWAKNK